MFQVGKGDDEESPWSRRGGDREEGDQRGG
jgi:hypothetical protein